MSGKKAAANVLSFVGTVTVDQVRKANKGKGEVWVTALNTASEETKRQYPKVDSIKVHGAQAHQSHNVAAHTNVLSVAFYAGKTRVVSGHIHGNGTVDYSKGQGSQAEASSSGSGFATGLTWQVNAANQAEYWDGTQWQPGEWSDEHQRWIAYYNKAWYAWI